MSIIATAKVPASCRLATLDTQRIPQPGCPAWCAGDLRFVEVLPEDPSVHHIGSPIRVPIAQHEDLGVDVTPERFDPNPEAGDVGDAFVHISGTDWNLTPAEARDLARALLTAADHGRGR